MDLAYRSLLTCHKPDVFNPHHFKPVLSAFHHDSRWGDICFPYID